MFVEAGAPLGVAMARQTIPALQEALNLARKAGIQTLLIAGTQTLNCVRASTIDALQKGYETIVLASCTSSMTPSIQQANLADMENAGITIAGQLQDLL